jgi:hypothetical protein
MKIVSLILLSFISVSIYAHDTFFAFAELEYKEMQGQLEASISVTAHDFETYLQKKGIIKTGLSRALKDSTLLKAIEQVLNEHFFVDLDPNGENSSMDGVEFILFTLEGYEEERNGTLRFYMHAPLKHLLSNGFMVTFNLLMDQHSEQQNKLTFQFREKKSTFVFLQNTQKQIVDLR